MWKKHVFTLKRRRQNQWQAVVHSKMFCLLKGLVALRDNVDAQQSKQSLQELSVNCYNQNLKRKTVSGYKFLHQTKRVKFVQIEHTTIQWRTARLQEHFEKWYFATALRSMRRKQEQKSVKFRDRQLLVHACRSWRDMIALSKEKGKLKTAQMSRLRDSLGKCKQLRVLSSWKSLRKEMNIKRFNEARALQFFIGFRAAPVVKALYVHMQEQKLKRSLLAKATHAQNVRFLKSGIHTWIAYVLSKGLRRLAANHRRYRLLRYAMTSLIQRHRHHHVEFKTMEEDEEEDEEEEGHGQREKSMSRFVCLFISTCFPRSLLMIKQKQISNRPSLYFAQKRRKKKHFAQKRARPQVGATIHSSI